MLSRAWWMRTRRPSIVSPIHSAVPGMSCMTPTAPAWLTTFCCQPDSCQATASTSERGTPWWSASRTRTPRIQARRATSLAIDVDISRPRRGPRGRRRPALGMTRRWPEKIRLGSAIRLAAAMALTLTP